MEKTPDNGATHTLTDSLGRVLTIRTMGPAGMLDLMEAAGELASNNAWVRIAMVVLAVKSIDEVPLPGAVTKEQVKQNAARLGNEGFVAVSKFLFEDEGKPSPEQEVAAAKN